MLAHTVEANLVASILKDLSAGPLRLISAKRSVQIALRNIAEMFIQPPDYRLPVEWLSGGNQQKVVLGKAFNANGRVLLLDEPTFGVDVRSRAEITARVRLFADAGNGVVWVTSDLQELIDVSDRILILAAGRIERVISNRPERIAETELTHLIQRSKGNA